MLIRMIYAALRAREDHRRIGAAMKEMRRRRYVSEYRDAFERRERRAGRWTI